MTGAAYIWLGAAIALAVVEGMTLNMVTSWFAGGAVAAFFTALFHGGLTAQIIVFVAVSAVLLACFRPLARRRLTVKPHPTNADRVIGRQAVVTEDIDTLQNTGAVRIDGVEWTARAVRGQTAKAGELVKIVGISGVKVVVEPVSAPARV